MFFNVDISVIVTFFYLHSIHSNHEEVVFSHKNFCGYLIKKVVGLFK